MSIEVKELKKSFGQVKALDGVSFTIEPGHIYGLLGNNGAGKTTLLSAITDRLVPDSGSITLDGERVRDNDRALGKIFMMSEQNLFPEELRVGKALNVMGMFYKDFDKEYALSLMEKFGLDKGKKITSLSTGYSSIFRLILALASGAEYVFYDEPVLGLDAQNRDTFYKLLLQRYIEKPCALVISTHLIAEVADIVEHTIIIKDGRIIKNAPTEELEAQAHSVSGPAGVVDEYLMGKDVMSVSTLGGLKTACVAGQPGELPQGLELGRMNLQDYYISLMNQEAK